MGISLQESNSSHPESDVRGLSKAKLVENSWKVCWSHRKKIKQKKNTLSLEGKKYTVFSLGCTCHWVRIMVSYWIFIYPVKATINKYFIHYSKCGYKVMWLILKQSAVWVMLSPASLWECFWDASWLSNDFGTSLQSIFRISSYTM